MSPVCWIMYGYYKEKLHVPRFWELKVKKMYCSIHWIEIYPVSSIIHSSKQPRSATYWEKRNNVNKGYWLDIKLNSPPGKQQNICSTVGRICAQITEVTRNFTFETYIREGMTAHNNVCCRVSFYHACLW